MGGLVVGAVIAALIAGGALALAGVLVGWWIAR